MLEFDLTNNGLIQESPVRQLAADLLADSSLKGTKYYDKEDEYTEKIYNRLKECDRRTVVLRNVYDSRDYDIIFVKADQYKDACEIINDSIDLWKAGKAVVSETIFEYIYNNLDNNGIVYEVTGFVTDYELDNEQILEDIEDDE